MTCIIVAVMNKDCKNKKLIYDGLISYSPRKKISPYLIDGDQDIVSPVSKPISSLPAMCMGSNAVDGKNLVIEKEEFDSINQQDGILKYIKRYMGAVDFLSGKERYCLWINDEDVELASKYSFISDRLTSCKDYRLGAGRDAKKVADKPHRFCYRTHKNTDAIIFPRTTTERRVYVPCGYVSGEDTVINEAAFAIYDAELYMLALLSSKMHYLWFSTTSGRLRTGFRYSVKLSYNTFPIRELSEVDINKLTESALNIIECRENYPNKSLSELYDPDKMPSDLLNVHLNNDLVVEKIFDEKGFLTDDERLSCLFQSYARLKG